MHSRSLFGGNNHSHGVSPLAGGQLGDGGKHMCLRKWAIDQAGGGRARSAVQGRGATRTASLAWLLKHPSGIIPIVGSTIRPVFVKPPRPTPWNVARRMVSLLRRPGKSDCLDDLSGPLIRWKHLPSHLAPDARRMGLTSLPGKLVRVRRAQLPDSMKRAAGLC